MILKELPVNVDAAAIARGLLELMDESEFHGVRFGLLPARVMTVLKNQFDDYFREIFGLSARLAAQDNTYLARLVSGEFKEFNMDKLVNEAVHQVTLALYNQVPMLV